MRGPGENWWDPRHHNEPRLYEWPSAVSLLADTLKEGVEGVTAVILDGIITQRLVDISTEIGVKTIVGVKMGNVTKQPTGLSLIIKQDLD